MADKIDMRGSVGDYDSTKNFQDFKPASPINSKMDEGKAFMAKDKDAKDHLTEFLQAVGDELRSATITAKASRHDYLDADWDAGAELRKIAFDNVDVPKRNPEF